MQKLRDIAEQIDTELDEKDTVREIAIKSSRAVIRLSSSAIRAIHRKEDYANLVREAKEEAMGLKGLLKEHPDLYHSGIVTDALTEMGEACLLTAIINETEFPSHRELDIPGNAYLLALGDTVGELRRLALEAMRHGDVTVAEKHLELMEEIYDTIMMFDYPNALVAIRRKQDIARSLIEKTRGEIAVAVRGKTLEDKIDDLKAKL